MRPIKIFGLVAITVLAAMALIGAGSASAMSTSLCKIHEDPCAAPNQLSEIHLTNVGPELPKLLTDFGTFLCLNMLLLWKVEVTTLSTDSPLRLATELKLTGCGSNAAHDNCTETVIEQPLFLLLKTALNLGKLSTNPAAPGVVNLNCTIGFNINCDYTGSELTLPFEGSGHTLGAGNGMVTANKVSEKLTKTLGGVKFLCPSNTTRDFLLEPLSSVYITS
jgi:hypothetical protein